MSSESLPPETAPATSLPDTPAVPERPGLLELFVAFAKMSLAGFGGVLVWARRAIVDQHRWMTADEFNEAFALCHFLPGPNIVNLSVVFGARFRGIPGSIAAFPGIAGALVATFAMCGPSAVSAYFVSNTLRQSSGLSWPSILQAALVPVSIGLMCASGLILALTSDRTWIAALLTIIGAAATALMTRLNPLWMLVVGGVPGFAGIV